MKTLRVSEKAYKELERLAAVEGVSVSEAAEHLALRRARQEAKGLSYLKRRADRSTGEGAAFFFG